MGDVKEDFKIIVRELNKANEIKDVGFSLNTSQSGSAGFITNIINGVLEGVIISCDSQFDLAISLDGTNIVLFDGIVNGGRYLPIRASAMWSNGENFLSSPEKWALNNKLRVDVTGGLNKSISFIVRYC